MAEKLGQEKTTVKGAIVSTSDLKEELQPKDVKQFQGVKRYLSRGTQAVKGAGLKNLNKRLRNPVA